jgi:tRNA U38,U39,U40 pseudouridine synthase TruA
MNTDSAKSTDHFSQTLNLLEGAFRHLEKKVPAATRKPWGNGFVFRYTEQTIQQAIIQKLARTISGLHAVEALLDRGLFQEQGMVQRAVDEIEEDVWFLSLALINNDFTARHKQYLAYFYAEEFGNPADIVDSHASRGMVSRDKIRAYVNQHSGDDATRGNKVGKVLTKAYSGFVHAASPHIMDMCFGYTPRFDVNGECRALRRAEFERDAMNYFYRGILSMAVAAKAFGDERLFASMLSEEKRFEAAMNNYRARRAD